MAGRVSEVEDRKESFPGTFRPSRDEARPRAPTNDSAKAKIQAEEKRPDEHGLSAQAYEMLVEVIRSLEDERTLADMLSSVDVAEVYSPPRVTTEAKRWGLTPGDAMDLTTGWDFTMKRHQEAAMKYIKTAKPKLLIGSPECRMFSTLQRLTNKSWSEGREQELMEATQHVDFVIQLYREQVREGRWFLHEHPASASSWDLTAMRKLAEEEGVTVNVADQCMYGLRTQGKPGEGKVPARKRTKFMTNSYEIAKQLQKRCDGRHEHQALVSGRAREAAKYPEPLCRAICHGLISEMKMQVQSLRHLVTIRCEDKIGAIEGMGENPSRERGVEHEEDGTHAEWIEAYDDVSGAELDPKEVRKARMKELSYVKEKKVWRVISRAEAQRRGIKVVQTRWIDINKGDVGNPIYRSRLVAKEFNIGKDAGLFAATPPLEALKMLVSDAATIGNGRQTKEKVIMVNDVARAFFEAPMQREVCVELPMEALEGTGDPENAVGLLQMSLYGTRDAAANFQREVKRFMLGIGFRRGRYNVSTYYHPKKGLKALVHGDDFVSSGRRKGLFFTHFQLA